MLTAPRDWPTSGSRVGKGTIMAASYDFAMDNFFIATGELAQRVRTLASMADRATTPARRNVAQAEYKKFFALLQKRIGYGV
jgi:hypothetical protein